MTPIYNNIGKGYDANRRADPEILRILIDLILFKDHGSYLDAACGTGNYTSELAKIGGSWKAFDQSKIMIEKAQEKTSDVEWSVLDVVETSYTSASFDSILCTLAIHHFNNLTAAFKEIARILAPTGRVIIFTSTPDQMKTYWLNHYFPNMLQLSISQMPSIQKIESALGQANLEIADIKPFFIYNNLTDLFLYSGKYRPEMYLSDQIRAGISSFRNFCSDAELAKGLASLKSDIISGKIQRIIEEHHSDKGDYCFLVIQKDNYTM